MIFKNKYKSNENEVELNCKCDINCLLIELECIKKCCSDDCYCNECCSKFNEIYYKLVRCLNKCKCNKCNCNCICPPGAQGAQGEPGTNGTDGAQGAQGEPGTNGTDGAQGAQGEPGTNGTDGAQGAQGEPGTNGTDGAQGAQGEPGTCECMCVSIGDQVLNGSMEIFENDIPVDWETTTPDAISQTTAQGNVHSGISAVVLGDGAILTQEIDVNEGCYYELSFFALANGVQVSLTATVLFDDVIGGEIAINAQDFPNSNRNFGYYKVITTSVPIGVTSATIKFEVIANSQQSLNLDDVSFSVA